MVLIKMFEDEFLFWGQGLFAAIFDFPNLLSKSCSVVVKQQVLTGSSYLP